MEGAVRGFVRVRLGETISSSDVSREAPVKSHVRVAGDRCS